jgi:hypothetical protein
MTGVRRRWLIQQSEQHAPQPTPPPPSAVVHGWLDGVFAQRTRPVIDDPL